jgi:hypothetical protein
MIIYKDDDHTYKNSYGDMYTSVTTVIKEFVPVVDWVKMSEVYLKKRTNAQVVLDLATKWGLSTDDIITKFGDTFTPEKLRGIWKAAGTRATTGGSNWHNWKEIQDAKMPNTVLIPMYDGIKSFNPESMKPNTTYLEPILRDHASRLAGQADKTVLKEISSKVRDYKTVNKDLVPDVKAYYKPQLRKKVAPTFKSPLKHLKHSSYWEYAVQLSLYGVMLSDIGFPPEELIIDQVKTEWVKEEDVTNHFVIDTDEEINKVRIVTEVIPIELPFLEEEARTILKYKRSQLI